MPALGESKEWAFSVFFSFLVVNHQRRSNFDGLSVPWGAPRVISLKTLHPWGLLHHPTRDVRLWAFLPTNPVDPMCFTGTTRTALLDAIWANVVVVLFTICNEISAIEQIPFTITKEKVENLALQLTQSQRT